MPRRLSLSPGKSPSCWRGMKPCSQRSSQNFPLSFLLRLLLTAWLRCFGTLVPDLSLCGFLDLSSPAFPINMATTGYKKQTAILSLYFWISSRFPDVPTNAQRLWHSRCLIRLVIWSDPAWAPRSVNSNYPSFGFVCGASKKCLNFPNKNPNIN